MVNENVIKYSTEQVEPLRKEKHGRWLHPTVYKAAVAGCYVSWYLVWQDDGD